MTVKEFRQICACAVDFSFYDVNGDLFELATLDKKYDKDKWDKELERIKKYDNEEIAVFTTFNDVIRVHVVGCSVK